MEANGKLYEFTRISVGVKNSVAVFQRRIAQLRGGNLLDIYVYLDNVTAPGRSREKLDCNVNAFLAAICRNKFTLNEMKPSQLSRIAYSNSRVSCGEWNCSTGS